MVYQKLKVQNLAEADFRNIWKKVYCDILNPIFTFDGILVQFFEDMFNHAFFESDNKKKGDKSLLSLNRCQKIYWIKDTLEDSTAILKQGWLKDKKNYTNSRRVALVKGNYIVVIILLKNKIAKFVTAYEVDNSDNLNRILKSPNWIS